MVGTIEEEAIKCREAHKESKIGDLVWCCHHGIEIERLSEPAEKRINYILDKKPKCEQAQRLHEFRPVLGKLPDVFLADWDKANADQAKAYTDWAKAYADWDKANADSAKAIKQYESEITKLHRQEVPDTTWNGISIFLADEVKKL